MAKIHVTTEVNGDEVEFLCEPEQTLLDVLRDELGLTGSKEGCASGDCGACSVLLDGRVICSCLALAAEVEGAEIETIEGLAPDGSLHPMQQAFHEQHALQCGYCTPGMILAAVSYLKENPDPTEQDVRLALEGNLCRCTGYHNIVKAVLAAAPELRSATASAS